MYTITFYSFKGGVGRTFALVNVGAYLAKRGRRVLLVDFDLEAPGLETFDRLRPAPFTRLKPKKDPRGSKKDPPGRVQDGGTGTYTKMSGPELADWIESQGFDIETTIYERYNPPTHPGLVEYISDYLRTKSAPNIRDFVYSPGPVGKKGGQLFVMPAGCRDDAYHSALANIDWLTLYREHDGFLLFEDMKAQWEQELKPDYVLIDSRTGHTDVEGICTRQLPDAVVVLFFPNEQNLLGLAEVCRSIRGEAASGLMKSIRLHYVMSNVPDLDDQDRALRRRLELFDNELEMDGKAAVIHRYESAMLFNQAIFVLDRPKSRLAREYRQLTRKLIFHNPADREGALWFLISQSRKYEAAKASGASESGVPDYGTLTKQSFEHELPTRDPLDQIAENFVHDPEVMEQVKRCREARDQVNPKARDYYLPKPIQPV
jgi:MinD-like ATPase involved in chromosome partitioning or flagellar assembly